MGLARKGLRHIVVDGETYAWKISPDSGYLTVVVEHKATPRTRLEARTTFGWHPGTQRPITPSSVKALVREALRQGWIPTKGAPPYQMNDIDHILDTADTV